MKPISSNKFSIKDTFPFIDWIKQQAHNNNYMCSFDVNSLFTNVPLDETINISINKLYHSLNPPNLPKEVMHTLMEFATKQSHFIFDWKYYDQINGVAMGSPLGPILANIFVCSFEEWFINMYKTPNSPLTWHRYVDGHFCLFNNKHSVSMFQSYLNACHPNILFMIELEENNKLQFLDILMKRDGNNPLFKTTVHRKKTFTGLYTKWDSFTICKYKINLICTLAFRYYKICSDRHTLKEALDYLKRFLMQNGFPIGIINYHLNDVIKKHEMPKASHTHTHTHTHTMV